MIIIQNRLFQICQSSFCDTLRLLGCFTNQKKLTKSDKNITMNFQNTWNALFSGSVFEPIFPVNEPRVLGYACLLLRLMYDMSLDAFDKPNLTGSGIKSPSYQQYSTEHEKSFELPGWEKRSNAISINLTLPVPESIIVHPGVVIGMLHLLPSISDKTEFESSLSLQVYASEVIRSLVRSERNQQVMCDTGMSSELLSVGRVALEDETHPLHQPLQYIIERLAAQALEPKDLR